MTAHYFLLITFVNGGPPGRINPRPGEITEDNEEEKKEEFKAAFLRRLNQVSPETKQNIKRAVICKEEGNFITYICQVYPELS